MKQYYLERLHWIFNYRRKDFFYCLLKTLCLIVGIPIYTVSFVVEMVFTFINMLFCWIPIFGVVMMVICKSIVLLFGMTFYLNILPDLRAYKEAHTLLYEVEDAPEELPLAEADEQEMTEENN